MRVLILAAFAVALSAAPASASCIMSYCKEGAASSSIIPICWRLIFVTVPSRSMYPMMRREVSRIWSRRPWPGL